MQTPDLIKIAPTLSAEERYKLIVPDVQKEMTGEKPLITESERQAILHFEDKGVYDEYTRHVVMLHWVSILWPKDIECEKLRVSLLRVLLSYELEITLQKADEQPSGKVWMERFDMVKETVAALNESVKLFYAYREAIPKMEQELYGVPFFSKATKKRLDDNYRIVDNAIAEHNDLVRDVFRIPQAKKFLKPMVTDTEKYLVQKPVPDSMRVELLIDDIKKVMEAEMRTRR